MITRKLKKSNSSYERLDISIIHVNLIKNYSLIRVWLERKKKKKERSLFKSIYLIIFARALHYFYLYFLFSFRSCYCHHRCQLIFQLIIRLHFAVSKRIITRACEKQLDCSHHGDKAVMGCYCYYSKKMPLLKKLEVFEGCCSICVFILDLLYIIKIFKICLSFLI